MDTAYLAILAAVSTGLFFGLHDVTVRVSGLRDAGSGVLVSLIAGYPAILILAFALGGFELVGLKAFSDGRRRPLSDIEVAEIVRKTMPDVFEAYVRRRLERLGL